MKNLNLKICLIFLVLSLLPFKVFAADTATFDRIVFFGDSLTDNGNLYSKDFGLLPKSPPYYRGRFSNGPVWSELVTKYFLNKTKVAADNYAVGGETVNWHNPLDGFLPYDLSDSIDDYYYRNLFADKSHTLFIIWMGGNDYINGDKLVPEKDSSAVVATIKEKIEYLISLGGRSFLLMNLPDMGDSPSGKDNKKILSQTTILHNTKLQAAVTEIQSKNPDVIIHLSDVNALVGDLQKDPAAFNQKYHTRITNITESCWTGGHMLQEQQNEIASQLEKDYALNHGLQADLDFHAFAHSVANNVDLGAAYAAGQAYADGLKPCDDPDAYAFWDGVHPTAVLHAVLAGFMVDTITQYYHLK